MEYYSAINKNAITAFGARAPQVCGKSHVKTKKYFIFSPIVMTENFKAVKLEKVLHGKRKKRSGEKEEGGRILRCDLSQYFTCTHTNIKVNLQFLQLI